MPNVSLNVPDESHFEIVAEQLELKKKGIKKNLKEFYYEIIELGLKSYKEIQLKEDEKGEE